MMHDEKAKHAIIPVEGSAEVGDNSEGKQATADQRLAPPEHPAV